MKTYHLVNNNLEISKFKLLLSIQRDKEGKELLTIYEDDDILIFYRISKGLTEDTENQSELPVKSLSWIVQTIEKFWRKPTEGGFPKNQHAEKATIDDEDIIISRTMNASYGEPGFKIVNKSRKCYILKSMSQEMQITDELCKNHLIPLFNRYKV